MKNKIQSIVLCFLLNITGIIMTMEEEQLSNKNVATALDLLKSSQSIQKSPTSSPQESPSSSPRHQTESISILLDEKQKDTDIVRNSQEKIIQKYTSSQSTDKIQSTNVTFRSKYPKTIAHVLYNGSIQENNDSYTITYNDHKNISHTREIFSTQKYENQPYAIISRREEDDIQKNYIVVQLPQAIKTETTATKITTTEEFEQLLQEISTPREKPITSETSSEERQIKTTEAKKEDDTSKDKEETEEKIIEKKEIIPLDGSFACIQDSNESLKDVYQGTDLINIHDNHYEITFNSNNIPHTIIVSTESPLTNDATHIIINEPYKVIALPQKESTDLIFSNWPPSLLSSSDITLYTCSTMIKKEKDGTYLITFTDNKNLTATHILNIIATENDLLYRYVSVKATDMQPAFVIDLKPEEKNTKDENIEEQNKEIKKTKEMSKEELKDPNENISYKNRFISAGVAAAIIAILVYAYKYDKLPDIFYQFSDGLSNLLKKILPSGSTS